MSRSYAGFLTYHHMEFQSRLGWKMSEEIGNISTTILTGKNGKMHFNLTKNKLKKKLKMNLKSFTANNKKLLKSKTGDIYCKRFNKIKSCYFDYQTKDSFGLQFYFSHADAVYVMTFSAPKDQANMLKKSSTSLVGQIRLI